MKPTSSEHSAPVAIGSMENAVSSSLAAERALIRGPAQVEQRIGVWQAWMAARLQRPLSHDPRWLLVLQRALGHQPYCVEAIDRGVPAGILPLAYVRSVVFGRFLVSLPYLNTAGVQTLDPSCENSLVEQAVALADELDVNYLELRHETELQHPALTRKATAKKHLRLPLPDSAAVLWDSLSAKVRNQIRKGRKQPFQTCWGRAELLDDFYRVFSHNMRDLGTPVYTRRLFAEILDVFADEAELCVVHLGSRPVAAALLAHGQGVTEVPSASSLRAYNSTNANMFMYWQLLERAVQRGQQIFDFGRSSEDSGTFRFKTQWGAQPWPAVWQYYLRRGDVGDMRPENRKYRLAIRVWRHLPVGLTRLVGPPLVRGIP